jgi:hypothetical protein
VKQPTLRIDVLRRDERSKISQIVSRISKWVRNSGRSDVKTGQAAA